MSVSGIAAISAIRALESVSEAVNIRLLDMMMEQAQTQTSQLLEMIPQPPEAPHPHLGHNVDLRA